MRTIGDEILWSFDNGGTLKKLDSTAVRGGDAADVDSYASLAAHVAELQYRNRDLVLMYRGQDNDFRNQSGNTSIRPNIMRPETGERSATPPLLASRFSLLAFFDKQLASQASRVWPNDAATVDLVCKHRILRWALLQHYEVCKTPLLDVSHSLRIAASFATDAARRNRERHGYLFVLGVPNLSGAVTASMEVGLQIVRLASVCPPAAKRPHIQEGYLLGEYPDIDSADQKALYGGYELDFGRRLVAKFRFEVSSFWKASPLFTCVPHKALYPSNDSVAKWANSQKQPRKKRK